MKEIFVIVAVNGKEQRYVTLTSKVIFSTDINKTMTWELKTNATQTVGRIMNGFSRGMLEQERTRNFEINKNTYFRIDPYLKFE